MLYRRFCRVSAPPTHSSLPGKDPNGCTTISSQNPTKAHLGPRALHRHINPSSFPPTSGNGSCCLLGSPSNKISCRATTLSTSGLFQLGLSHQGGDCWLAPLMGATVSTWGRWKRSAEIEPACMAPTLSLHGPHYGPAPGLHIWSTGSGCGNLFLRLRLSADWDKKGSQILGLQFY